MPKPTPIKSFVQRSEYAAGHDAYRNLKKPNPEDSCWAGLCLAHLGRNLEAAELLATARALGFEAAGAILATVYRLVGESRRGREVLESIKLDLLDAVGQSLFERERGAVLYGLGQYREALHALERAVDASANRSAAFLRPGVVSLLGFVLAHAGRDDKAITYLSLALDQATPVKRVELLAQRATCLMNLGRLAEAKEDLQAARASGECSPSFEIELLSREGQLALFNGLYDQALNAFLESADLAREHHVAEAEFSAELFAAHTAMIGNAMPEARAHLSRAKGLANAESERELAHLDWDYGALLMRADDAQAIPLLERAAEVFDRLGHERELGLVLLYQTEMFYRLERRVEGDASLRRATDARYACGAGGAFAVEVRDLPFVFDALTVLPVRAYSKVLYEDWRSLEQQAPSTLLVRTMGDLGIALDGEKIHVTSGLAKTVEVVAYLLKKKQCTLEDLQTDIFADKHPDDARNYIHVIRAFIRNNVQGLAMPFDLPTRTYTLEHPNLRVLWDVAEVKRAINLTTEGGLQRALELCGTGRFLAKSDNEWVSEYRSELEWDVSRAGLRVIEDLFARGSHVPCVNLARGLLEVNPVDASVAVVLLHSVAALEGSKAAMQELARVRARFKRELGEVPEVLDVVAQSWAGMN